MKRGSCKIEQYLNEYGDSAKIVEILKKPFHWVFVVHANQYLIFLSKEGCKCGRVTQNFIKALRLKQITNYVAKYERLTSATQSQFMYGLILLTLLKYKCATS